MDALYFLDPLDAGILPIVHHKLQQSHGLIQGDAILRGLTPHPIHNVTLNSKKFREDVDDDRCLTVLGKPEHDAARLV